MLNILKMKDTFAIRFTELPRSYLRFLETTLSPASPYMCTSSALCVMGGRQLLPSDARTPTCARAPALCVMGYGLAGAGGSYKKQLLECH